MLEAKDISFKYPFKTVLKNVNIRVQKNKVLGIVGSSGSGKTTLLKILAGLLQPTEGLVLLNKEKILGPNEVLVAGSDNIKLVAQDFGLRQFVKAGSSLNEQGSGKVDRQAKRLKQKLRLDLDNNQQTHEISGGQKQRLALGQAIYQKPAVLLLDEPFSNLDYSLKQTMKNLLLETWKSDYMVLVAHDPSDILEMCDELLVLKDGSVTQFGETNAVFNNPKSKYAAELLGKINSIPNKLALKLNLPLNKPKVKNQLIRPNHLGITENGFAFTVLKCCFNGKCFEIEAISEQEQVKIVLYSQKSYSFGEEIHVSGDAMND